MFIFMCKSEVIKFSFLWKIVYGNCIPHSNYFSQQIMLDLFLEKWNYSLGGFKNFEVRAPRIKHVISKIADPFILSWDVPPGFTALTIQVWNSS